jgi:hypothetical protein
MKSWKTTVFGAIGALGTFLITQDFAAAEIIGQILMGLSTFLLGLSARDNDVSSEDAGAK